MIILAMLLFISFSAFAVEKKPEATAPDLLQHIKIIAIPSDEQGVFKTAAEEWRTKFSPDAQIVVDAKVQRRDGVFIISSSDSRPELVPAEANSSQNEWYFWQLLQFGSGQLIASRPSLLLAAIDMLQESLPTTDPKKIAAGVLVTTKFNIVVANDNFLTGRRGFLIDRDRRVQNDDLRLALREMAGIGATHVYVNELAQRMPFETGPDGEIYYRFYSYLPDFDQFTETKLNQGIYPREYLDANMQSLKFQAGLAESVGLTAGMHIANPRSVPEKLLERYPFLRGARVDHTFRAFQPRYTLTLAHPAVRWHYAQLLQNILREAPNIGFVKTLINDSGSGFEYTASLYPGRNGGPYIVREWQPDDVIARAAARNVVRYYHSLRDAAQEINPDFRIITGLKNIAEEAEIILEGLENGIDRSMRSQRSDVDNREAWLATMRKFEARGSYMFSDVNMRGSTYIPGIPAPWHAYNELQARVADGFKYLEVDFDTPYLVGKDINREVFRGFQFGQIADIDTYLANVAQKWLGAADGDVLNVWRLSDLAVQTAPTLILYGGLGFTWYRFWVRPFVPDIGKIPEKERAYYEEYMLSVFNNPHNIDFGADMLWQIHGKEESARTMQRFDEESLPALQAAIDAAGAALQKAASGSAQHDYLLSLRDRLHAYHAYQTTLRNICAWIAGVHGYLDATEPTEKAHYREIVREMVANELANTRRLLALWQTSKVDFMPVREDVETMHDYGPNFGELLKEKIALMEKYGDAEPSIDPDYMWRMPNEDRLQTEDYLHFK